MTQTDTRARDLTLDMFIEGALKRDGEIALTFLLPGGIVTGDLISGEEYLRRTIGNEEYDTTFGAGEVTTRGDGEVAATSEPRDFVCLGSARYLSGGIFVPTAGEGLEIRVRIADISAWSFHRVGLPSHERE